MPLYNSIEFIYTQDYGTVVLLAPTPAPGPAITQVPSQYRLQQYAATIRAQRRTQLQKLLGGSEEQTQKKGGNFQTAASGTTTGVKSAGTGAPSSAPAPAPQAAPAQQAAPQAAAPAAAHVDIRV